VKTGRKKKGRTKLSTTVDRLTYEFLEGQVRRGEVSTLAEALDGAVGRLLRQENRERLAQATAAYFAELTPAALEEENEMAAAMAAAGRGVDFDREL
jgi:hypothetical protein